MLRISSLPFSELCFWLKMATSYHCKMCALLVVFFFFFFFIASTSAVSFKTITVDTSGHGNFKSIQAAVNSVPPNNRGWVRIHVKAGVYREKVVIPRDKPFIFLQGEGLTRTVIVGNDHSSIIQSPTFSVMADNFVAKSISFENNYNLPGGRSPNQRAPAVAAMVSGDKISFYSCGFYGVQDTLWDDRGRHYFKDCFIQGAVDFIFGAGRSIYEGCVIAVLGKALEPGSAGFITAQSRNGPNDVNGFVFKECKVLGEGRAYLGRPWRQYATVIFYKTQMANIVVPAGWDAWHYRGKEKYITFVERDCSGPGADRSKRVPWEKDLSLSTLSDIINLKYIDAQTWLPQQP